MSKKHTINESTGGLDPPVETKPAQAAELSISMMRGLVTAGCCTQAQFSQIEEFLRGEGKAFERKSPQWMTISEACRHARISRSTLWRYSQAGLISIHKLQGKGLVDKVELDSAIATGVQESKKSLPALPTN